MTMSSEENERPSEWLLQFERDGGRYSQLVEGGGISQAAYRVARARSRTAPLSCSVPTVTEVWAAACDIAWHLAMSPPNRGQLLDDCQRSSLLVIADQRAFAA